MRNSCRSQMSIICICISITCYILNLIQTLNGVNLLIIQGIFIPWYIKSFVTILAFINSVLDIFAGICLICKIWYHDDIHIPIYMSYSVIATSIASSFILTYLIYTTNGCIVVGIVIFVNIVLFNNVVFPLIEFYTNGGDKSEQQN